MSEELNKRIQNDFTYHKPEGDQTKRYELVRTGAKSMAELINEISPDGREKNIALTKLDEVVFWTNAAIARNK